MYPKNKKKQKEIHSFFLKSFFLCSFLLFFLSHANNVHASSLKFETTDFSAVASVPCIKNVKSSYQISVYKDKELIQQLVVKNLGRNDTRKVIYDLQPNTSYLIVVKNNNTNKKTTHFIKTKKNGTYKIFNSYKEAGRYSYKKWQELKSSTFYLAVSSSDYTFNTINTKKIRKYDHGPYVSSPDGYYGTNVSCDYVTIGKKTGSNGKKYVLVRTRYQSRSGLINEKKVNQNAKSFVQKIKGKSKKDKIRAIYKIVADRAKYKRRCKYCGTAYGALIQRKASCGGYTKAFSLLCDKAGIECIEESGLVKNEGHAWNMVKYGGKWYMCDVTFGDTSGNMKKYFMISKSNSLYRMRKKN